MIINLEVGDITNKFSDIEQLGILCTCVENAFRYDFESIARKLNMQGRSYLAGRGNWDTRGLLLDFILLGEASFMNKHSTRNMHPRNIEIINKKRTLLQNSLDLVGINSWVSEFLKVYSVTWVIGRITDVLSITRPGITYDNVEYELNLSLEGVR